MVSPARARPEPHLVLCRAAGRYPRPVLLCERSGRWYVFCGCLLRGALHAGPRLWNRRDAISAWNAAQAEGRVL